MIRVQVKKHAPLVFFIALYFFVLGFKLIVHPTPFYDWDESLYIQTGREMLHDHYFLFPLWQGQVWLDKPPLIPLVYGLVAKLFFFVQPEISTRIFTALVSIVVLTLLYKLFLRAAKDRLMATLGVVITSLTPIFLQRSQVVNLDIFLLLGWVGYILFFENSVVSLLFLLLAILSKSLIGFYAPALMTLYLIYIYVRKKISVKELIRQLRKVTIHIGMVLSWYVGMIALFGEKFWRMHIIESHFRRVTSSIEFHFGQKTFYIDLAREQLGLFFWVALMGLVVVIFKYFKKEKQLFYALYLLPWFIFLNLTKTKIFWYFYAAIPQFGFLATTPMLLFKKGSKVYYFIITGLVTILLYQSVIANNVFATVYSKPEPYYYLSLYAKDHCGKMAVLMDKQTRDSFDELDRLGLLITTTKWWGSHPSMVYYFGKEVDFIYHKSEMVDKSINLIKGSCVVTDFADADIFISATSYTQLNTFGSMHLFVKNR